MLAALGYGHRVEASAWQSFRPHLRTQAFEHRECRGLIKCTGLGTQLLEALTTVVNAEIDQLVVEFGIRYVTFAGRFKKGAGSAL
jgi:hypothetical protein